MESDTTVGSQFYTNITKFENNTREGDTPIPVQAMSYLVYRIGKFFFRYLSEF